MNQNVIKYIPEFPGDLHLLLIR